MEKNANNKLTAPCEKKILSWIVYILECADRTLYTGITKNLEHRLQTHAHGKGAKYTRGRGPFSVLYSETHPTLSQALHREAEIKRLDHMSKRNLASSYTHFQKHRKR